MSGAKYLGLTANRLARIASDLDAENARLRAMQDTWAENDAKLRELVRELYEDQCDECDRWRYRDRLRELGIGVGADA